MRRALSLAEAIVALALVGVLLIAALNTAGAAVVAGHDAARREQASLLAEQLLAEILAQPYDTLAGLPLGSTRASFDEVSDYANWTATPPEDRTGTALLTSTDWTRSASVESVDTSDYRTVRVFDTGVKRITVSVSFQDRVLATRRSYRTAGWDAATPRD